MVVLTHHYFNRAKSGDILIYGSYHGAIRVSVSGSWCKGTCVGAQRRIKISRARDQCLSPTLKRDATTVTFGVFCQFLKVCLSVTQSLLLFNPLKAELNPICYLLALLAYHFLHVSRIRVKSLTLRLLMSYIYMESLFLMFLDHTQRRSIVGRTPLDE